jgi:hypothetical protein
MKKKRIMSVGLEHLGFPGITVEPKLKDGQSMMVSDPTDVRKVLLIKNIGGGNRAEIKGTVESVGSVTQSVSFFRTWRGGDWSWRLFYSMLIIASAMGLVGIGSLVVFVIHLVAESW